MTYSLNCPYCEEDHAVNHPGGYAPIYVDCAACDNRFIMEPARQGVAVFKIEDAPCCSDPECRELEYGASGND